MKMVIEKGGKAYVFERAAVRHLGCEFCIYESQCRDAEKFDVEVWLYCLGLLPTIYICTEIIDGRY